MKAVLARVPGGTAGRNGFWWRAAAYTCAVLAGLTGAGYLVAWFSGVMAERGVSRITVKTNTALCLLLLGVGLVCVIPERAGPRRRWLALVCALLLVVIGALTTVENVTGWDLKLDQLLAREPPGALGVLAPNRPGLPSSLCFMLGGAALVLLARPQARGAPHAQAVALAIGIVSLLALIGHTYQAQPLYGIARYTAIAWETASGFLLAALSVFCARPTVGFMAQVNAPDPGGALLRWLVLPMILLLVFMGWLRLTGERLGWFDTGMGTSILVLVFILTYSSVAFFLGRRMSESAAELASVAQFPSENPHPVMRLDAAGRVLYANQAAKLLFASEHWRPRGPVGSELRDAVTRALASGANQELELACRDGRVLAFTCAAVPDRGYVNLYGRDVTDARRAERALQYSEHRLRATFDNAGVGIVEVADDDRFIAANERVCEILARRCDELLALNVHALTWPEDRPVSDRVNAEIHAGLRDRVDYEKRYIRGDGTPIWCHVTVSAVRDDAGRWVRSITTIQDISARKAAEDALRESESFHRQTLESIPGMVFTTRPDGYCDYQSRQWAEFTGISAAEHLGDAWMGQLHPDDRDAAFAAWRAAVAGLAPYDVEYRVRRHDGAYEWFKVRGRAIRDARGQVVRWFGVAISIDAIKRAEEELQAARRSAERARASAEQANRAKDHFLAVLSHELRTPLMPVLSAVSLLQQRGAADAREALEVIRRNVELEARLIDDLLDVTRIARGKVELQRRPVTLCEVIQRAVEVCQPDLVARRLRFEVHAPDGPYVVRGDPTRLQQVLWNLLRNAIKFTPPGGAVAIHCRRTEQHALVAVTDTGIGIDPQRLPRLFDPFEQADRAITRQFGGLGLGLTISKALVELHGGRLEAHSDGRGRGATFRVRLPLAPAQPDTPQPAPPAAESRRGLRILLVEDHADTARMMRMLLSASGHDVDYAPDVARALGLAGEQRYDLLISDLGLPDASGLDLLRELRRRGHALPAIALSGYGQEEDLLRSREAGFARHLVKPISPEDLEQAIATAAA